MVAAEYTIGAEYIRILIRNGMAYLTSRYRMARADDHMPTPAEMHTIIRIRVGNSSRFHVGLTR